VGFSSVRGGVWGAPIGQAMGVTNTLVYKKEAVEEGDLVKGLWGLFSLREFLRCYGDVNHRGRQAFSDGGKIGDGRGGGAGLRQGGFFE